ncbi:MAG: AbrB/MazE/SpoVT family DNA-binding domain-containing protein [Clostridia bacterium]|nr:AbrB/MazE/SpoVT family DNA-binding domain-containing protein [Clostridia bacterium]
MKSTGFVKKIDELGRILIPKELRSNMELDTKDALEMFVDGDRIVLQKYQPACIFCNNADDIIFFEGRRVCASCLSKLKSQY